MAPTTDPAESEAEQARWLSRPVAGIGTASFLADVGHEIPTALLPSLLTSTLGAPAVVLGLIEGISDALAGGARFVGGALADDPRRRRRIAVGGYASTAVLAALTGAAGAAWQVGVLRAGAWAARGLRVPARNALLADVVPASAYGRAYGFERMMDNLGAIVGPLLALVLVATLGVRAAIGLSVIPGLLAAAVAIIYAIRHTARSRERDRVPLRLRIRPVMQGKLGRLIAAAAVFEVGNVAATLLILRATDLLRPGYARPPPPRLRWRSTPSTTSPPRSRHCPRAVRRTGSAAADRCWCFWPARWFSPQRVCRFRLPHHESCPAGDPVPRGWAGDRMRGDRPAFGGRRSRAGRHTRRGIRVVGHRPSHRQLRCQRWRRTVVDHSVSHRGVQLPRRLDGRRVRTSVVPQAIPAYLRGDVGKKRRVSGAGATDHLLPEPRGYMFRVPADAA
ncbi:MFS transporter [Fodinicola feengrottensis]|uniref:MFS transporter n=1 Tax=Fodinicola feengrottensis TaxID=435914 RepID=UPI00244282EF|nr:MFS transporter [Fodinicola feengrottensis]